MAKKAKIVVSLRSKKTAVVPAAVPVVDRTAAFLASAGLVDDEIAGIQSRLAILPIDVELVGRARAFVSANPAGWNHRTWTAFTGELREAGYAITNETEGFVGVIAEGIRAARQPLAKAA